MRSSRNGKKKKLHYAMVKGSKIKAAINRALNPTQSHPVHLLDHSVDPPVLQTDTARVGELLSNCLSHLGGDPHFRVDEQLLQDFIHRLPKCPESVASAPLELPDIAWLQDITQRASPAKATGEDEINYYVIHLLPTSLQAFLLRAVHRRV